MPGMATDTEAWPAPGRSTTITRGRGAGFTGVAAGSGAAGAVQSPKVRAASAKPCSGSMSPVSTSTALSGR